MTVIKRYLIFVNKFDKIDPQRNDAFKLDFKDRSSKVSLIRPACIFVRLL